MTPREICILLMSGSLGLGGGVAVSQKTQAAPKKTIANPAPQRPAAVKRQSVAAAPAVKCILEGTGPIDTGIQKEAGMQAIRLAPFDDSYLRQLANDDFGGQSFGPPIAPIQPPQIAFPAIPEPGTWTMMISGFGLIGLTIRKRPTVSQ